VYMCVYVLCVSVCECSVSHESRLVHVVHLSLVLTLISFVVEVEGHETRRHAHAVFIFMHCRSSELH